MLTIVKIGYYMMQILHNFAMLRYLCNVPNSFKQLAENVSIIATIFSIPPLSMMHVFET